MGQKSCTDERFSLSHRCTVQQFGDDFHMTKKNLGTLVATRQNSADETEIEGRIHQKKNQGTDPQPPHSGPDTSVYTERSDSEEHQQGFVPAAHEYL